MQNIRVRFCFFQRIIVGPEIKKEYGFKDVHFSQEFQGIFDDIRFVLSNKKSVQLHAMYSRRHAGILVPPGWRRYHFASR